MLFEEIRAPKEMLSTLNTSNRKKMRAFLDFARPHLLLVQGYKRGNPLRRDLTEGPRKMFHHAVPHRHLEAAANLILWKAQVSHKLELDFGVIHMVLALQE